MKLFEHPDFDQFVLAAAEHFTDRGLRPAIIEKDYYVTEALRIIATAAGGKIIFKGGTSLSKGWNLIERFSEDIDIFLDPLAFDPPLGKNEARLMVYLHLQPSRSLQCRLIRKKASTLTGYGNASGSRLTKRQGCAYSAKRSRSTISAACYRSKVLSRG